MSDTQQTADAADNDAAEGGQEQQGEKSQEQTFTQADLDKVVKERVARERAKFADYDDLKTRAGEKATADERIADLEKRYADAEAGRLRSDIAARHGISADDRDLFLTGTDEETLTAQAERLAERDSERKKQGNYVPKEGKSTRQTDPTDDAEFARQLFGSD